MSTSNQTAALSMGVFALPFVFHTLRRLKLAKRRESEDRDEVNGTKFLKEMSELCLQYAQQNEAHRSTHKGPLFRYNSAAELMATMENEYGAYVPCRSDEENAKLSLDHGVGPLLEATQGIMDLSVNTGHAMFFNQLYARVNPVGLAADFLVSTLNTNCHTFEVAPVFTSIEKQTVRAIAQWFGYPIALTSTTDTRKAKGAKGTSFGDDDSSSAKVLRPFHPLVESSGEEEFSTTMNSEGLFTPGGAYSNLYGLLLARYRKRPATKNKGNGNEQFAIFCGDQAHYSVLKGATLMGLGADSVFKITTGHDGRLTGARLGVAVEKAIKDGRTPLAVVALAGSTVLGCFDEFVEIRKLCDKFDMWFHVDACWGGAAVLSPKTKHLMIGFETSDSFAFNAHKMLGAPLPTGVFVTRHFGMLRQCNSANATYLFQKDKLNTEYDMGDLTIQCGRRGDAVKMWMMIKAYGKEKLGQAVTDSYDITQYMAQTIRNDITRVGGAAFHLVIDNPQYCNLHFWYIPPCMRPYDPKTASKEDRDRLTNVAGKLKSKMQMAGLAMIGYQPWDGRPELPQFFRMVLCGVTNVDEEVIDTLLREMDNLGQSIVV